VKLSVVIPVRNERATVVEVIERVRAVDAAGLQKELIVVDGASTDGTREALAELRERSGDGLTVVLEDVAAGKGAAVRRGLAATTGDLLIIQDGDLELDPEVYPDLIRPILDGRADVVYGSRFLRGRGRTVWPSYFGNRLVTGACSLLFWRRLTDALTAYKVLPIELARSLDLRCNGFDLDGEITAKLLRRGVRLLEVPVAYEPRTNDEGKKLRWRVALGVLWAIVRVRFTGQAAVPEAPPISAEGPAER
jgi:glycosyltransferase involved in cell wall biosynthesis